MAAGNLEDTLKIPKTPHPQGFYMVPLLPVFPPGILVFGDPDRGCPAIWGVTPSDRW